MDIDLTNVHSGYTTLTTLRPSDYIIGIGETLLGLAGVLAFVYLLWGSVQWIMAGGDKDAIDKSRKKIITALIGLSLAFSVFAIMRIINILFGTPTSFVINRMGT